MKEPETTPHIHDCTSPTMTCSCGFMFPRVGRFCVSFDVYDNATRQLLVNDGFNCETVEAAIAALRRAADTLEHRK